MKITVLIPTYNRKKELRRALMSVEHQSRPVDDCIIVDDGSTDGTDEMIADLSHHLSFPLEYFYKENGGVLRARYDGLCKCKTEFVILLDADDELVDDAIEYLEKLWSNFSDTEKEKYYGIEALCWDTVERKIKGGKFSKDINKCSIQKYIALSERGERVSLLKTELIKKQYSEYETLIHELNHENGIETNFVPEGMMHMKYAFTNRSFCANKIIRIYHSENSSSMTRSKLTLKGCYINYFSDKYMLQNFSKKPTNMPLRIRYKYCTFIIKFGLLLKKGFLTIMDDAGKENRLIFFMAIPAGYMRYRLGQKV